jgi:uncharacterized protein Yka (UPF0111/DUF47 family)
MIRWLVPREDGFYAVLEAQAATAHDGAVALRAFRDGSAAEVVRAAVQDLEHKGDKLARDMEEALARTFVTPIDREDLQRLSSDLDDILDLANGAVRASVLYGVEKPTEPMGILMDLLTQCTDILRTTMPNLRKNRYEALSKDTRTLRDIEKKADTVFQEAVSALFKDPAPDARRLLREKAVLEDLENAIDHCEVVAKTLANIAVKHG